MSHIQEETRKKRILVNFDLPETYFVKTVTDGREVKLIRMFQLKIHCQRVNMELVGPVMSAVE